MKKVSYIIIIILCIVCIVLGTILYKEKNKTMEVINYYYECVSKLENETNNETKNYRIDINKDYSIKKIESYVTYIYNEVSFEAAKKGYLSSDSNVIIDDENYSIKVPGNNTNLNEKMWAITFVEQLENNNFTCELKSE